MQLPTDGASDGGPVTAVFGRESDLAPELDHPERELRRAAVTSRGPRPSAQDAASLSSSEPTVKTSKPITGTATVPVLMYHHIAVAGADADAIRRDLSVPPEAFAAQLSYLASNGYHPVSLSDLLDHLNTGRPLPPKPIVLTFDDGYVDNYTAAFPALQRHGFKGTFFLITDFAGHGEYMSWDQAREMSAAGMHMESHTLDHPDLSMLPSDRLSRELVESRRALEAQLGTPVRYLSYPAGRYSPSVVRAAQQAGYLGAVTTAYGDVHKPGQPFEIARIRIRGADTLEVFAQKVHGPAPTQARGLVKPHANGEN